jgi:hypothetical protein
MPDSELMGGGYQFTLTLNEFITPSPYLSFGDDQPFYE